MFAWITALVEALKAAVEGWWQRAGPIVAWSKFIYTRTENKFCL